MRWTNDLKKLPVLDGPSRIDKLRNIEESKNADEEKQRIRWIFIRYRATKKSH